MEVISEIVQEDGKFNGGFVALVCGIAVVFI